MVSVCMATYNGEKYIKEQVDSILKQLGADDELVVSDDGSEDSTIKILESYRDDRIKIHVHIKDKSLTHVGEIVCANFANAINNAHGDYIFLSDQDDIWLDDKVRKVKSLLDEYGIVATNAWKYNGKSFKCTAKLYTKLKPLKNYTLRRGKYYGCVMAFKREKLKYALPIPKRMALHDVWLGFITEMTSSAYFLDEPLIYYRVSEQSVSHSVRNSISYMIFYRLYFFFHAYGRILKAKFF